MESRTTQHASDAPAYRSHSGRNMRHPLLLFAALPIALFFVTVAWSPPFMLGSFVEWLTSWQKELFSFACHQDTSRSFILNGVPLAVCTRCTGIYSGFFISLATFSVFSPFVKSRNHYIIRIFIIMSIVLVSDGFANLFDIWQTSNVTRSFIGLVWGISVGTVLVDALTIPRKHH